MKQPPYPQANKLPFRSIIVSASQGKVFSQFDFSPTATIDEAHKKDTEIMDFLFDDCNPEALARIMDTEHKYQKKNKNKLQKTHTHIYEIQ